MMMMMMMMMMTTTMVGMVVIVMVMIVIVVVKMVMVIVVVRVVMMVVMMVVVVTREWLRMGQWKRKGDVGGEGVLFQTFARPRAGSRDHQLPERGLWANPQLLCTRAVGDPECPETPACIPNKRTMRSCPPHDPEG